MVYFRVDLNSTIASGHVMRCLSLADAFTSTGVEVKFLVSDNNSLGVIEGRGYEAVVLNSDWNNLLPEVPRIRELFQKGNDDLLIIDTYQVTEEYVNALSSYTRVCYLGSKHECLGQLYALVNYSTDIDRSFYESCYQGVGTTLLLGPAYAPLRSGFQGHEPNYRAVVSRVLVTTGNTDSINMTGTFLSRALSNELLEGVIFDVVVGSMFSHRDELFSLYEDNPRVQFHESVTDMASLMEGCDVAVSANGTTVYELSAIGLPAVTFALVEEQVSSAVTLDSLEAVIYCGEAFTSPNKCADLICENLVHLSSDFENRKALAESAHCLIDGNGCRRITEQLLG